jgi:hypothetical protein
MRMCICDPSPTKFRVPESRGFLLIDIHLRTKENFRKVFKFLRRILHKNVTYFSNINYHKSFQGTTGNYTSVPSTTQFHISPMLSLLILRNRNYGVLLPRMA